MSSSPWFIRHSHNRCPTVRLFCFPYAGGNASTYATWAKQLPDSVDVVAVQLPGRATRLREPAHTDMAHLVSELKADILPLLDVPYVTFGYSLGSRIAFELVRQLQNLGAPLPQVFIAAAGRAPHLPSRTPPTYDLPDAIFLAKLAALNGTPREVLENRQMMELLLPSLKADFRVADTYQPERTELKCPLAVLAGLGDREVNYPELLAWRELTPQFVGLDYLAGDHFFINQCGELVVDRVHQLIRDYAFHCAAA